MSGVFVLLKIGKSNILKCILHICNKYDLISINKNKKEGIRIKNGGCYVYRRTAQRYCEKSE